MPESPLRLPERWFAADSLRTSIDHFISDVLFFRPMRDQPPAHEDKLTLPALGLPNYRDIPAWSHVIAGKVEWDLCEVELALNICIDFAYVTSAHGIVGEWSFPLGDDGGG